MRPFGITGKEIGITGKERVNIMLIVCNSLRELLSETKIVFLSLTKGSDLVKFGVMKVMMTLWCCGEQSQKFGKSYHN